MAVVAFLPPADLLAVVFSAAAFFPAVEAVVPSVVSGEQEVVETVREGSALPIEGLADGVLQGRQAVVGDVKVDEQHE
ncbi:hypothetical protein [Streptomyces collinus]|uniref:hypothetical protein n=1 Tax=Streptomyces collinus TaxID=42684 RepID=UPI0029438BF5|nr:hypothetical protein [Streptomyces collinus]